MVEIKSWKYEKIEKGEGTTKRYRESKKGKATL